MILTYNKKRRKKIYLSLCVRPCQQIMACTTIHFIFKYFMSSLLLLSLKGLNGLNNRIIIKTKSMQFLEFCQVLS